MRWEHLCKPKDFGGIGFKQLHTFNIAMLGKQVWKLITKPESFIAKILKSRYFLRTSVNKAKLGHNKFCVALSCRCEGCCCLREPHTNWKWAKCVNRPRSLAAG